MGAFLSLRNRRGFTLIYATAFVIALAGMCSLVVDFGRRQLLHSELQAAADAAARHAVSGLSDGTAVAKAIAAAAENTADGTAVVLTAADVTVGTFDAATRIFVAGGATPNAVRVRARRDATSTTLAHLVGVPSFRASAESFAAIGGGAALPAAGPSLPGLIGLHWLGLNSSFVDTYDPAAGYNPASAGGAIVGTNGHADLNSSSINGTLFAGFGPSLTRNSSTITTVDRLTTGYTIPLPTLPPGTINMGNYNGPTGSSGTLPAGRYFFNSFNLPSGRTLTFTGPVELYVSGSFRVEGNLNTHLALPANTAVRMLRGAGVDLRGGGTPLRLDVIAPDSSLVIDGRPQVFGRFHARHVPLNSTRVTIDRTLGRTTHTAPSGGGGGPLAITFVRPL